MDWHGFYKQTVGVCFRCFMVFIINYADSMLLKVVAI